jgi:ribosomal protein L11 methyltransferase
VNKVKVKSLLPDDLADGLYDVVVANILSNPLKVLAPMLAGRVRSGGQLILSGVLERQAQEVAAAYAPWLTISVWQARDGWVCLSGVKA